MLAPLRSASHQFPPTHFRTAAWLTLPITCKFYRLDIQIFHMTYVSTHAQHPTCLTDILHDGLDIQMCLLLLLLPAAFTMRSMRPCSPCAESCGHTSVKVRTPCSSPVRSLSCAPCGNAPHVLSPAATHTSASITNPLRGEPPIKATHPPPAQRVLVGWGRGMTSQLRR